MRTLWPACLLLLVACDDGGDAAAPPDANTYAAADAGVTEDATLPPDAAPAPRTRARLTRQVGELRVGGFEEITNCVAWTLDNDAALYVEEIELRNGGAFHHSNWFVVPEEEYPGPDGFFDCRERGFDELEAAVEGTVIFAQSTQARYEVQRLGPGVVIKIPPRHKVVAGVHLLNPSPQPGETFMRMSMEVIHPQGVEVVVAPFRLQYQDLDIAPRGESRHIAECDLAGPYERATGRPFDLKLYWVLPHYHELGNYFDVTVVGGPRDGESLHRLEGFDADANGKAFDPPVDLTGATGLRLTCGFDNPRPEPVGYGIGDQEMCVMLGFADSAALIDANVNSGNEVVDTVDGRPHSTGPCGVVVLPKNAAQGMPTEVEREGELVVPASDVDPGEVEGPPECVDTPADAAPAVDPTLAELRANVFRPSCTFSACHAGPNSAAGLDLKAEDLHAELLGHTAAAGAPLVVPGDAAASALYQRMSTCGPTAMPRNAPTLLDPGLVAAVRDWIQAGAPE